MGKNLYLIAGANGSGKSTIAKMLLSQGKSLAVESTLSGKAHLAFVRKAKSLGYRITLVYSFVDSVDACIARIAMRVRAGGHHVPKEDLCPTM